MGNLNYYVKNLCCVSLSSRTSIEMSTVVWDCDKIVGGICRFCDKSWPRQTLMIQLWERCDVQNGHHFIFKDMKSHVIIGDVSLATVLGFFPVSNEQYAILPLLKAYFSMLWYFGWNSSTLVKLPPPMQLYRSCMKYLYFARLAAIF